MSILRCSFYSHPFASPLETTPSGDKYPDATLYRPTDCTSSPFYRNRGLPIVLLLHGGFWKAKYGMELMTGLAEDLASCGLLVLNMEYRRVTERHTGVWKETLHDICLNYVMAESRSLVDSQRIAVVGHSAGGTLALWLGRIPEIPSAFVPHGKPYFTPRVILAQAAVSNLVSAAEQRLSDDGDAVQKWLGGEPGEVPDSYALANPIHQIRHPTELILAHGTQDTDVPFSMSKLFAERVRATGRTATLLRPRCDHYALMNAKSEAWKAQRRLLLERLR